MDNVMYYICYPLGYIMKWCREQVGNYGLAIILFTLVTKLVILPVSVWVHKNSIRMVSIQPQINRLKAKFYGDRERIAEEQTALYRQVGYNPFANSIPLLIQLLLLAAVVYIIKQPLTHVLRLDGSTIRALADALGVSAKEGQLEIVRAAAEGRFSALTAGDPSLAAAVTAIRGLDMSFCGLDLGVEAADVWGLYTLVPVLAGGFSFLLCWVQNRINILQADQSRLNKYGMTVLSVGISLVLGFFVSAGVALYWIASNVFAILQQYLLNAVIDPKKFVDMAELEASRQALNEIEKLDGRRGSHDPAVRALAKRERADYKRFFGIVNKHLVIYSERSGFYKYYEALIDGLLKSSNITIHYITSDPDDAVFELAKTQPRIRPYYIGLKKLIPLMMRLDADMVAMTTPDLDTFYIKRSLVRKDAEYIYIPHDMMSIHMGFHKGALDHFDTVFATGPHVEREIRSTERVYGLPEKTVVPFGYPLAEKLEAAYEHMDKTPHEKKEILIAPSWQEDNLLDSVIDTLIAKLRAPDVHLTVRPHPEYVKRYGERMRALTEKYADVPAAELTFELDFSSNRSIYSSDLLITDWSAIAYEFCFSTKRPVLFVNTKIKMENPDYRDIPDIPVEISLRDEVGRSLEKQELADSVNSTARALIADRAAWEKQITDLLHRHLFSYGQNGAPGVTYILTRLRDIQTARKQAEAAARKGK